MKISVAWFVLLAVAFSAGPAAAQRRAASRPARTQPAASQPMKTIWDYQKELGLSAQQIASMKTAVVALQKAIESGKPRLASLQKEAQALVNKEAPSGQIRAKLLELSTLQIDLKIADIDARRKIVAALRPDQLTKWRSIQASVRGKGK